MPTVLILMQPDLGTASLVAVAGFIAILLQVYPGGGSL